MNKKNKLFLIIVMLISIVIPFNVLAEEEPTVDVPGQGTEETTDPSENPSPSNPEEPPIEEPEIPDEENNNQNTEVPVVPEEPTPEIKQDPVPSQNTNTYTKPSTDDMSEVYSYKSSGELNTNCKLEISVIDSETKKLLKGVTYELQDEDGNVLYEIKSTTDIYKIENIKSGNYYLVIKTVPEKYKKNKEKIKVEVKKNSNTLEVEIEKKFEEQEDNKLNRETTLLMSVGMFDVALMIGISIYVKKNKIKK